MKLLIAFAAVLSSAALTVLTVADVGGTQAAAVHQLASLGDSEMGRKNA